MPVMDGIELIAEVRKRSADIKIIILSNLEDFQYAKEAIKHGVSEYMIKSDMMPRDFEQVLLKLKGSLEAVQKNTPIPLPVAPPEPFPRENFLMELVERGTVQGHIDEHKLAQAGLADSQPLYLLHISLGSGAEPEYGRGQTVIRNILEQLWDDNTLCYDIFPDRQGNLNIIISADITAQPADSAVNAAGQQQ
ncbi:hypothetical protein KC345_g12124 [Hortaea werneckii]|nr:hypothetical protein KC345_g12124 [Hortaea werneckii]